MIANYKYRPDIDGLRAVAILSVVVFHAFPGILKSGFIGVDIFFVISGFLISSIIFSSLDSGKFSFREFYARRIRRIFPALILVLSTSLIVGWFLLLSAEYKQLGEHAAGGAGFISNFMLWSESGYFDTAAETKPLLHLWSLGIEEQFYIFWPLLMWVIWKLRLNKLAIIALIGVSSFLFNLYLIRIDAVATFYSPLTRFWELLIGVFLAYLSLYETKILNKLVQYIGYRRLNDIASLAGIVFLAIGFCVISKQTHFPSWRALFPTLGAFFIIFAGASAWFNRVILSNKLLVWIGLISFPLYLWHWVVLFLARIIETTTPSIEIRIIAILFSVLLSWITYVFIERPIRSGSNKTLKTTLLVLLMFSVGSAGYYISYRDGFRYRFPLEEKLNLNGLDIIKEWRWHTCHLQYDKGDKLFPDRDACAEQEKRPLVLLWGDSQAATLYAGLKSLQSTHNFGIAQLTANSCPPLLDYDNPTRPLCREINDGNIEFINKIKPDIIILHAGWYSADYQLNKLQETIAKLRKIGIKKIVIIGPVPKFNDILSRIIANNFGKDIALSTQPLYIKNGLDDDSITEEKMKVVATKSNTEYISAHDILCNENGCLSITGGDKPTIAYFDGAHLTPAGSAWLMESIWDKILNKEIK